jgi:hypothetical protein
MMWIFRLTTHILKPSAEFLQCMGTAVNIIQATDLILYFSIRSHSCLFSTVLNATIFYVVFMTLLTFSSLDQLMFLKCH